MRVEMAFGRAGLEVTLPEGPAYSVLHARSAAAVPDARAALDAALDSPIGGAPLVEMAAGKRTAAISVCDITRPAPNRVTLPPVLERLHRAGIPVHGVTLLIATGLHRAATEAELLTILGPEIAGKYRVINHNAKAEDDHRSLGETRRGTPVAIDWRFLDADLRLTLGLIEPHLMLGFSGGRKLVAPGLAAQATIQAIHAPRFMREALATEGSTAENPLHAELLEIAQMAGHDFMLDVTLTRERTISGVFAGDPVEAHAAGVQFLKASALEVLPEPVDAAITSAAGFPLDLTFYQTIKGVTAVRHIVKPGGPILIVSACAEGVGSPEFAAMARAFGAPREFLDAIRETPVQVDQWQLEKLALVALEHPVFFYMPGVEQAALGGLGDFLFDDIDTAVERLVGGLGPEAQVAVLPDGPYTYARVQAQEAVHAGG